MNRWPAARPAFGSTSSVSLSDLTSTATPAPFRVTTGNGANLPENPPLRSSIHGRAKARGTQRSTTIRKSSALSSAISTAAMRITSPWLRPGAARKGSSSSDTCRYEATRRAHRHRSTYARDDGRRAARAVGRPRAGREAGPVDGVRGHRGRDASDQRDPPRPLPHEAWHPPEERLYPVLDDLLEDWRAGTAHAGVGRRRRRRGSVIGHRFSGESQLVRDLLDNNQVSFKWLEVDETCCQAAAGGGSNRHRSAAGRAGPRRRTARRPGSRGGRGAGRPADCRRARALRHGRRGSGARRARRRRLRSLRRVCGRSLSSDGRSAARPV